MPSQVSAVWMGPILTFCSLSEALQQLNTEAQTYTHMASLSAAWNISTVLYTCLWTW